MAISIFPSHHHHNDNTKLTCRRLLGLCLWRRRRRRDEGKQRFDQRLQPGFLASLGDILAAVAFDSTTRGIPPISLYSRGCSIWKAHHNQLSLRGMAQGLTSSRNPEP